MTWEEAIEELERLLRHWDDLENGKRCFWGYDNEAIALALSALSHVSRGWVEKVWRGEWKKDSSVQVLSPGGQKYHFRCSKCGYITRLHDLNFCSKCGAPMTDEAVEMVVERLEALKDEKD